MVKINQNEILRVSPKVKRYVKAQAALNGMSMKDFANLTLLSNNKMEEKDHGNRRFKFGF